MKGYIKKLLIEELLREHNGNINADIGLLLGINDETKNKIKSLVRKNTKLRTEFDTINKYKTRMSEYQSKK